MRQRVLEIGTVLTIAAAAHGVASAQYNCSGISQFKNSTLASVTVADGLADPVFLTAPPGDTNRIFILERSGRIKIHKHGQPPTTLQTFLDITSKVNSTADGEMGLLGLAFDPDFATTRAFWVYYSELSGAQVFNVVARYTASVANPDVAFPISEVRLLRILKPETNHNGGMMAFGPDGFLYIFTGDGGGGGDVHGTCGNGQNRATLLGKVLRIDPRGLDHSATPPDCGLGGANYGIPASNPFRDGVGIGSCDEIWAYGLRNPWRSSFDAANGDLYIADVGQNCWEELNWAPSTSPGGENYGWRQMEGLQCYNPNDQFNCNPAGAACAGSPPCSDPSFTQPVVNFQHSGLGECAVTGGYVYRGCRMSNYLGTYFYSDFCASFVKTIRMVGGVAVDPQDVTAQVDPQASLGGVSSFGVDGTGELYVMALSGNVQKIVPIFDDLEVSRKGAATRFLLGKTGDWTWEDLYLATDVPVSFYRVYRASTVGAYSCVFKATTPAWPAGGDPAAPSAGQLFTYVVTAVNAAGAETEYGTLGSFNASTCP